MIIDAGLRNRCRVNTNEKGDRFVGIKADSGEVVVCFPVGYQLPETEGEIKQDILHLFQTLTDFTDSFDRVLTTNIFEAPQPADFPINAYLEIINYFMETGGYYKETEPIFRTRDRGKIDWAKTVKRQKPLIQSNLTPVYTLYTVRDSRQNENKLITHIHRYCVYESFSKLGWLFTPFMPEPPIIPLDVNHFIIALNDKLAVTHNDQEKKLFVSMKKMLEYIDDNAPDKQFYFGTDYFENVWEKLIDRAFGVKNKNDYFPRTRWRLRKGKHKEKYPLEPDTIMKYNNKMYVLDAKYYRYGVTGNSNHLPNSSSINKQITYGEYIQTQHKVENDRLFNAFIMPYNSLENYFGYTEVFRNVGEAVGDWKGDTYNYERIQGIVVDTRYLIYHYTGNPKGGVMELAKSIEEAFEQNNGGIPSSI